MHGLYKTEACTNIHESYKPKALRIKITDYFFKYSLTCKDQSTKKVVLLKWTGFNQDILYLINVIFILNY